MEKIISLKELNENGILMLTIKKHNFLRDGERHPFEYHNSRPVVCYIHYYHDEYIVTIRVMSTTQFRYYSYEGALNNCRWFLEKILGFYRMLRD